jgi:hypothetical protein
LVETNPKSSVLTLGSGLALLIPAAAGLLLAGVPTIFCPLPALTVIPAFFIGPAAVIMPTVLFFLWHPGLFKGDSKVPRRTYALVATGAVLSIVWFVGGWKWGLQYQGTRHVRFVCIANIAWLVFLGFAFAIGRKRVASFKRSLFLHWILFCWLAWYAFPYLGELP